MSIPARYRNAAVGLWTRCGGWSAGKLTDGEVSMDTVESFGGNATKKLVDCLVQATLWDAFPDRIVFRNWDKWQRTRAQVERFRASQAEKKRRQREAAAAAASSEDPEMSPGDTQGDTNSCPPGTPQTPRPRPPKPVPTDSYVQTTTHQTNAREPIAEHIPGRQRRHPTSAAKTVVRQTLGYAGYPRTTIDRLATQVDKLTAEGHPDTLIRESLTEWDQRDDCGKPEFLPTVLGDLVKQSRAHPGNNGRPPHKLRGLAELAKEAREAENTQLENAHQGKELQ